MFFEFFFFKFKNRLYKINTFFNHSFKRFFFNRMIRLNDIINKFSSLNKFSISFLLSTIHSSNKIRFFLKHYFKKILQNKNTQYIKNTQHIKMNKPIQSLLLRRITFLKDGFFSQKCSNLNIEFCFFNKCAFFYNDFINLFDIRYSFFNRNTFLFKKKKDIEQSSLTRKEKLYSHIYNIISSSSNLNRTDTKKKSNLFKDRKLNFSPTNRPNWSNRPN